MRALSTCCVHRYPQVAGCATGDLTPEVFLDGRANTIYVVAAGHDQDALRPMILALVTAMYEAAIIKAHRTGPLDPRLFILMDEAANIAPGRNHAPWLSQCGEHGIVIATIWQSIAQIDPRYGRAAISASDRGARIGAPEHLAAERSNEVHEYQVEHHRLRCRGTNPDGAAAGVVAVIARHEHDRGRHEHALDHAV
jgi:hypothetical protein